MVRVSAADLLDFEVPGGQVTEAGLETNVSVGVRYIASWLEGVGAAALDNLMEDAATAEISRSQVWQWVKHGKFDESRVRAEIDKNEPEPADTTDDILSIALSVTTTQISIESPDALAKTISAFAAGITWRIMYIEEPERGALNAMIRSAHDTVVGSAGVLSDASPSSPATVRSIPSR